MFHGFADGNRDRREEGPVLRTTQMRRLTENSYPTFDNISDEDRQAYFGLIPSQWTRYAGRQQEETIRKKKGEQ